MRFVGDLLVGNGVVLYIRDATSVRAADSADGGWAGRTGQDLAGWQGEYIYLCIGGAQVWTSSA